MSDLREIMQGIYDHHKKLTPSIVLDEARDPNHPLHSRFEWDDAVAGEAWRKEQAHRLIASAYVTYKKVDAPAQSLRAFHAVRSSGVDPYVYEPLDVVVHDEFMSELVRRDMEREWKTLYARYEAFDEFRKMVKRDIA